ncbi:MAG: TOBE-like domain-containing protein, partial [Shewanella sp.]
DNALQVTLDLVTIVGPTARLEVLTDSDNQLIHVEIPKVQFKQLGLTKGDKAWIQPSYTKVFLGEGI